MDREEFDNKFSTLLNKAKSLIPSERYDDLPFMESAPDVHDWHEHEHVIWGIGEEIRQLISNSKKEMNKSQSDEVLKICLDNRAGRGRESFVMLLGKTRYSAYADEISALLKDDDVDGHVINILYKMKAFSYGEDVKPFLNHNRTWIKNEAKRYLIACEK